MNIEDIEHTLKLAGAHVASLMNPEQSNREFAASAHPNMPIVYVAFERTWDDNRVWDLCTVTIDGKSEVVGNRCAACNEYMRQVALAITS